MRPKRIHHITLICRDMDRTVGFYTEVLGLKLVKQTVNYDDPGTRHFYFGDEEGRPGTVVSFFEYPDAEGGGTGAGSVHHMALEVADAEEQAEWKIRLEQAGVRVSGPYDRTYFRSIYFRDPDGTLIELATRGPGFTVDETLEELGERFIVPEDSEGK